jgi:hypothetical protein
VDYGSLSLTTFWRPAIHTASNTLAGGFDLSASSSCSTTILPAR